MVAPSLWQAYLLLLLHLASLVNSDGTPIPIDLYTDTECATPSAQNANASIPLQVCAVTPGLASVLLVPFPCTSGNVQVYAFTDTICGSQDTNVYRLGDNCIGPATADTYAAIMLSCNEDDPGTPTGTTTIAVGAVATAGGASTTTPATADTSSTDTPSSTTAADGTSTSTPESSSSSATPSSTNASSSGWDSFSTGGKVGTIVGGGGGGLIAIIIVGIVAKTALRAHKQHLDARNARTGAQSTPGKQEYGGGGNGANDGLPPYNAAMNGGYGGSDNGYSNN